MAAVAAMVPALAHLLHVRLHLRLLLRREHVHELLTQLFVRRAASLRVRLAAFGMRLVELLHDLLHLRFLLVGQIHAAQHAHEAVAAAVAMALPLPLVLRSGSALRRRLAGLLRKYRNGSNECGAQCRGNDERTKGFHWVFKLRGDEVAFKITHDAGELA